MPVLRAEVAGAVNVIPVSFQICLNTYNDQYCIFLIHTDWKQMRVCRTSRVSHHRVCFPINKAKHSFPFLISHLYYLPSLSKEDDIFYLVFKYSNLTVSHS